MYRKRRCFGDGVLWRTGRRAGDEDVPSQNAALVLQGVFSGAVDRAGRLAGSWCISAGAMKHSTKSGSEEVFGNGKGITSISSPENRTCRYLFGEYRRRM